MMNMFVHARLGHFLMNEAGADGGDAGGAAQGAAEPAAVAEPTAAAAEPAKTPVTQQDTLVTEKPKEGDKPAGEESKPNAEEQQGAPEAYADFTVQEGFELDAEVMGEFQAVARELNLTQEQAQGLVNLQNQLMAKLDSGRSEYLEQVLTEQRNRWADEVKNDPELGGANFEKTREVCGKAMQAFGSDDLRILLNESGIGNNPAIVKMFHQIGTALQEDRLVMPGVDSRSGEPKRAADVLFPGL